MHAFATISDRSSARGSSNLETFMAGAACFLRFTRVSDMQSFFIVLSEAVDQRADKRVANGRASIRSGAWRNAFRYGKINDGVQYLYGSGAMTPPQGGNE